MCKLHPRQSKNIHSTEGTSKSLYYFTRINVDIIFRRILRTLEMTDECNATHTTLHITYLHHDEDCISAAFKANKYVPITL